MVTFFKSKPPTYKPKTGEIVLTRQQFTNMLRTRSIFARYAAEVGPAAAATARDNMYDEQICCVPMGGVWKYGVKTPNPDTVMRFSDDAALATLFGALDGFIEFDLAKIKDRRHYIGLLKTQMTNGQLYQKLTAQTEPEASYFVAKDRQATLKAPAIPGRTDYWEKASQWLTKGVLGSTQAYTDALIKYRDGPAWPLGGNDHILRAVWQTLAPDAPSYRGWNNAAYMQKYPSNIGGTKLLDELLADLNTLQRPASGNSSWYDRALYFYGAAMTAQPFTDGNKRICRFGYAMILGKGGVAFVAPNGKLGSEVANMM